MRASVSTSGLSVVVEHPGRKDPSPVPQRALLPDMQQEAATCSARSCMKSNEAVRSGSPCFTQEGVGRIALPTAPRRGRGQLR